MTTPKTLHLHTFRNGYHVALDDTTNIPTYPMQYVVSFRTPDQRGEWAGPYTRQGFFLSYVNAKEYFDFVIEAYEKDLASLEEQERRHNAAIDQYRAMRRATAHLSEQEQQQAINDFRCGKYNQEQPTTKTPKIMTQQELEVIFAQRREEHAAKMRELQLQEAQIQKQRNILKAEYKAGNKALDALKNGTPETFLLNHRKRVGYVLRHNLGKLVHEFESKYYDTAQAVTKFNIEEDGTMTIHITIPAKEQDEQA